MKTPPRTSRNRKAGATLIEVLASAALSVFVMGTALVVLMSGLSGWARGTGAIDAQSRAERAVRLISMELREAMSIQVDADGMGCSYRLPQKDANGNYLVPAVWDGVPRRIELRNGVIWMGPTSALRPIARGVITTDPESPNRDPYRLFVPGSGTVVRRVDVMVAIETFAERNRRVASRYRETLYLRNVPIISK